MFTIIVRDRVGGRALIVVLVHSTVKYFSLDSWNLELYSILRTLHITLSTEQKKSAMYHLSSEKYEDFGFL